MSEDHLTIECGKCHSTKFRIPTDPQPNDIITCVGCGASSRFRDLQASAKREAKAVVDKLLKDTFRKAGLR